MPRPRLATLALVLSVVGTAPAARAQVQRSGPEVFPGKSEVSIHTGASAGVAGQTPGGFKFSAEYGYRVSELAWLELGAQLVFGARSGSSCFYFRGEYDCGGFAGYGNTFEPMASVKLKLRAESVPVVGYARFGVAFIGIYDRGCGDNGFALAGRVGGGAEYYITRNLGVGAELNLTGGPGFYGGGHCTDYDYGGHLEAYVALDFALGATFVF